jgi:hypothetical protein
MPEKHGVRMLEGVQNRMFIHRAVLLRRVAVSLLLLYFGVMVDVGSHVYGTLEQGYYFTHIGYDIFPIPYKWGILFPAHADLDLLRSFIFFIFIGQGMWVLWVLLGIVYIVEPLIHWAYNIKREQRMKNRPVRTDRRERIGILTGIVALFSVYLSVTTFRINLGNYGLLPLIVVSSLSIMVIGFLVVEILNAIRKERRIIPSSQVPTYIS